MSLNAIDLGVIAVLLVSAFFAYVRGFVHEILSVAAWIGAIFVTVAGFSYVRPYARRIVPEPLLADIAAGTVVFIVCLVVLSLITRSLSVRVRQSALNALDRSLGLLFGLVRGAVLVCIAYIGMGFLMAPDDQPDWIKTARSMPLIEAGAGAMLSLLPRHLTETSSEKSDSRMMQMVSPEPQGGKTAPSGSYGAQERQGLQRLIESIQ
jgi:membrane protein required for colicin V production